MTKIVFDSELCDNNFIRDFIRDFISEALETIGNMNNIAQQKQT